MISCLLVSLLIIKKEKEEKTIQEKLSEIIPGIVCWGDSLTEGVIVKKGYPDFLYKKLNSEITDKYNEMLNETSDEESLNPIEVINLGVGGETSATIAGRNGAVDMVLAKDITIPAKRKKIKISLVSLYGGPAQPVRAGDGGTNPVTINGVEGVLTVKQESAFEADCQYYFKRSEDGDEVVCEEGTVVHTFVEDKYLDYWMIIFMGTNGGYDSVETLVRQHKAMVDQQQSDKYIILGMHSGKHEKLEKIDDAMKEAFGDHYISLHDLFTENDLSEYGVILSEDDIQKQSEGSCPRSLLVEGCHFGELGYEIIAEEIYKRMVSLEYFAEIENLLNVEVN